LKFEKKNGIKKPAENYREKLKEKEKINK